FLKMNRGKISFGKIGFSLSTKKTEDIESKGSDDKEEFDGSADEKDTQTSIGGFGSFGKIGPAKTQNDIINEAGIEKEKEPEKQQEDEMNEMMGFSSFGKKAREFDLDKIVEETRKTALERNRDNLEKIALNVNKGDNENKEGQAGTPAPNNAGQNADTRKNNAQNEDYDDDDEDFVGPPLPPEMLAARSEKETEEDEVDDESDDVYKLPITHELLLSHGSKTVSALAVDPSGARLVTGGLDYEVKYWDFQGMDLSRDSFRSFYPADGYPISNVDYSCTGDKVLVVSGSQQCKVYDRDGIELFECAKGDMYINDMAKTKGHISSLTYGCWHPKDKTQFLTSSRDGTLRIWNVDQPHQQKTVIKTKAYSGLKIRPIVCTYSRDGLMLGCACDDGTIQLWDTRKNYVNVLIHIKNSHEKGTETSSLCFSYDNKSFVTRGGDDTLKLWDIRNYKEPVHVKKELFNRFSNTDALFSPNDQLVVTGTSLDRGDKAGKIVMLDRSSFNIVHEMDVGTSHVCRINWHPRLNQLMVGCGDGNIRLLYDPQLSHNGAVLVAGKKKKRAKQAEVVVSQQVITPHALPMFREERHKSTRKQEERDRKDPQKSHQPELPIGKAGSGGRVAAGGSTLSSYIIRNMGMRNLVHEEGDPREALLKFAKDAAENPYWVTPAYAKNQPKTIFQEEEKDETADDEPDTKKQKTT
ncbi:unnamed protein product, partial [Meganyctiphanes norvegica]